MPDAGRDRRSRLGLAGLMLGAGTMHFVAPSFFDELVPSWMPGSARTWTHASGVAELAAGGLVLHPRTTRLGGWVTLAVLLGVYPANIWDSVDHPPTDARGVASLVRLPLQLPLLWWAYRHATRRVGDDGTVAQSKRWA